MNKTELYKRAIALWGVVSQVNMAIEECSELIMAICHSRRDRATLIDVAEEIADVEIMCGQLRLIIREETVSRCKAEKLIRIERRVNKEVCESE